MRGRRPASQETCRQPWSHAKRAGRGVLAGVEAPPVPRGGGRRGLVRGDVPQQARPRRRFPCPSPPPRDPRALSRDAVARPHRLSHPDGRRVVMLLQCVYDAGAGARRARTASPMSFSTYRSRLGGRAPLCGVLLALLAGPTAAQEAVTLDELSVAGAGGDPSRLPPNGLNLRTPDRTASRLGLTPLETPASLDIVSGETARLRGQDTIAEAVTQDATGITTIAAPGNGNGAFTSRGFAGPNSIQQLYDGTRFYVGANTVTFPFDTWNVERIEVLRGPSSVLYGDGAIGGAHQRGAQEAGLRADQRRPRGHRHRRGRAARPRFRRPAGPGGVRRHLRVPPQRQRQPRRRLDAAGGRFPATSRSPPPCCSGRAPTSPSP